MLVVVARIKSGLAGLGEVGVDVGVGEGAGEVAQPIMPVNKLANTSNIAKLTRALFISYPFVFNRFKLFLPLKKHLG